MLAAALGCPRILAVWDAERNDALLGLFSTEPFVGWDLLGAESFTQARYQQQHVAVDLILVSHEMLRREGPQALGWLTMQKTAPTLFLGNDDAALYAQAYEAGVTACLPWNLNGAYASLLHTAMVQTMQQWQARAAERRTREQLVESRRDVDRLVQMIWRMTPRHDEHWYTQRHVLERLDEELARCQRHKLPFSIAVAEVQAQDGESTPRLPDGTAQAIVRGKRRSDVVGQYGPNGFLLLMMQTPKTGGVTCCRRLHDQLEKSDLRSRHLPLRSYFGIASMNEDQNTAQALLRIAEQNLDTARTRNDVTVVAG